MMTWEKMKSSIKAITGVKFLNYYSSSSYCHPYHMTTAPTGGKTYKENTLLG